jgi:hypothetical protein
MGMINTELGLPATQVISLNDSAVRALAQVPAGVISLSNFYGKSNIALAGYIQGGIKSGTPTSVNSVVEFSFPTESTSVISATTPTGSELYYSWGSTPTTGYSQTSPTIAVIPATRSLASFAFSTKTYAVSSLPTVPATGGLGTTAIPTDTIAYTLAGSSSPTASGGNVSYYSKFTMPTQTVNSWQTNWAALTPGNSNNKNGYASWTAWKNYSRGFVAGGQSPGSPSPVQSTSVRRMLYPTETVSTIPGAFNTGAFPSLPTNSGFGVGQSSEHGYTFGQFGPAPLASNTNIGRVVFSTETFTRDFQSMGLSPAYLTNSGSFSQPTAIYNVAGLSMGGPPGIPASSFFNGNVRKYVFGTGTFTTIPATMPARSARSTIQSTPYFG